MTLRNLPEIDAGRLPEVCAFQPEDGALKRWNAGVLARDTDDNKITILDVIGDDIFGEGVTARRVSAALRSIGDKDVVVDINSPGGDFFEGVAIYNALREHPAKITVRILGIAASAASIIAMAGDDIQIGKAGFVMVHNAWVVAIGNRHDLIEAAETIAPFDDAMAGVYARRSGVEKKTAEEWMAKETWFNGDQAIEAGLATALLPADVVTEDKARAVAGREVKAVHRVGVAMAKSGLPRSERRALLGEVKGGTLNAVTTGMQDAAEVTALLNGLRETLKT